jgi:hypothetical protein
MLFEDLLDELDVFQDNQKPKFTNANFDYTLSESTVVVHGHQPAVMEIETFKEVVIEVTGREETRADNLLPLGTTVKVKEQEVTMGVLAIVANSVPVGSLVFFDIQPYEKSYVVKLCDALGLNPIFDYKEEFPYRYAVYLRSDRDVVESHMQAYRNQRLKQWHASDPEDRKINYIKMSVIENDIEAYKKKQKQDLIKDTVRVPPLVCFALVRTNWLNFKYKYDIHSSDYELYLTIPYQPRYYTYGGSCTHCRYMTYLGISFNPRMFKLSLRQHSQGCVLLGHVRPMVGLIYDQEVGVLVDRPAYYYTVDQVTRYSDLTYKICNQWPHRFKPYKLYYCDGLVRSTYMIDQEKCFKMYDKPDISLLYGDMYYETEKVIVVENEDYNCVVRTLPIDQTKVDIVKLRRKMFDKPKYGITVNGYCDCVYGLQNAYVYKKIMTTCFVCGKKYEYKDSSIIDFLVASIPYEYEQYGLTSRDNSVHVTVTIYELIMRLLYHTARYYKVFPRFRFKKKKVQNRDRDGGESYHLEVGFLLKEDFGC